MQEKEIKEKISEAYESVKNLYGDILILKDKLIELYLKIGEEDEPEIHHAIVNLKQSIMWITDFIAQKEIKKFL